MATRIKDIATIVTTPTTDDYIPLDGSTNGTRKMPLTDVRDTNGNLRDIPLSGTSGTLVAGDRGKFLSTSATVTVPASTFSTGQAVTIFNNSSGSITVAQGASVTLRLAGTATTGSRTLAAYGVCTLLCSDGATSTFVISGAGLT